MGETPEQPKDKQPQSDQGQPKAPSDQGAGAKSAYNQRMRESSRKGEKREKGPAKEAKEAGGKAGDKGKPPEPPEKYTPEQGVKDAIKDVIVNLLSESVGAAKMVADYAVQFITAVGEAHDKNKQAAIARGVQYSLSILSRESKTENTHVKDGKPYSVKEMADRVWDIFGKEINEDMKTLKIENRDADKQLRQGIKTTVENLNRVLAKAKTPDHRRQVIDAFVKEGQKRISQAYKKRSRRKR